MALIEKWRKFLDIGGHAGVLLTNPSKAFDCVDHQLLTSKLQLTPDKWNLQGTEEYGST